ncbi:MAG: hypothetical protein WDZ36_01250 [Balneolaceae bacterium]
MDQTIKESPLKISGLPNRPPSRKAIDRKSTPFGSKSSGNKSAIRVVQAQYPFKIGR